VLKALDEELGRHFFPDDGSGRDVRRCPACEGGKLSLKLGRFGAFIGCSNYPNCRYTRAFGVENADDDKPAATPDTELGIDPASKLPVAVKKGPYGQYIQLGGANGDKPKRVSLPKGMEPESVTLDIAIKLLALPREIGRHPETGEPISAGVGRFGPYLKLGSTFASLGADDDVLNIGLKPRGDRPRRGEKAAGAAGRNCCASSARIQRAAPSGSIAAGMDPMFRMRA